MQAVRSAYQHDRALRATDEHPIGIGLVTAARRGAEHGDVNFSVGKKFVLRAAAGIGVHARDRMAAADKQQRYA